MGVVTSPLLNGISRIVEVQADLFSLDKTKNPAIFVSMIRKLGEMNMADFEPNRWIEWLLYDHPSIGKRIAFAEKYQSRIN